MDTKRVVGAIVLLAAGSLLAGAATPPSAPAAKGYLERQRDKIDALLQPIRARSAPGAQVYFLGVAGYGGQRVFAEEIALASRRVADRYGSGERSLRLVNDRRDLETWPHSSGPTLQHALNALGAVMDDEDVLIVALSSHGVPRALVLSQAGLREDWINGADLARMFDEAEIRWRVVIVSACFSGGFVKSLADSRTIVITASAANRESFGCSDARDLTYFGESFYRDGLARTTSLRAAFEFASRDIRQKESGRSVRHSRPQAHFGPLLEAKLQEMLQGSSVAPIR